MIIAGMTSAKIQTLISNNTYCGLEAHTTNKQLEEGINGL